MMKLMKSKLENMMKTKLLKKTRQLPSTKFKNVQSNRKNQHQDCYKISHLILEHVPMPKIQEMLLNIEGFKYATSLELNMGYYHSRLSTNAINLCTIISP